MAKPKNLLRQLLIDEEGLDLNRHLVDGIPHIGIGHNLQIEQTDEELEAMGVDDVDDVSEITEAQAFDLFEIDVDDAINDVYPTFTDSELDDLGETRRAVILSMVFQLGGAGFRKFKNFIASVKSGDFESAAAEMLNSRAAKQTPARWQRASFAMKNGYFKEYHPEPVSDDFPDFDVDYEKLEKEILSRVRVALPGIIKESFEALL